MATPVIMPKQGQSVETCIISRWFKSTGDRVSTGDLLFSYETDKAAFDLESAVDGILLEIFFGEGAEVPVLMNVAVIGQPGESADSRLRISPRAKRLADDKKLNYIDIQGSGPNGRIITTDIEKALSGGALNKKTFLFQEQNLQNNL
ncbi:MAG: E3 binding domain-containing protein [Bacteroidales bacterium]|jgi:pyruvate dehydrogenase E2 component (dihydrolipoamide acetyltransferase)|nr:E3 binding domain-containing protein [Bacteroidales bacterium]